MASSKALYLLALAALIPAPALGDTGVVSAVGYGKESPEAINSLLRSVMSKYFKDKPEALSKSLLQNEILPNSSSFVQSYKILEGGKGTSVSLSANVDLDIIRALFSLSPASLGEPAGAKALVVAKGARLPDGSQTLKPGQAPLDPYTALDSAARERFSRRQFELVRLSDEEMKALSPGDDVASVELLRGLGARAGARLALGISSRYESFENENSHNKEQRIVVATTLVDVKSGAVLGRSSANVMEPKGRKEQYSADLQRTLAEEAKDLFHETFVSAGKKLGKVPGQAEFTIVRIEQPANAQLVARFRALLESIKGVQSVVEYSATRGSFDFALTPVLGEGALAKALKALSADDILVTIVEPGASEEGERKPAAAVMLAPKAPVSSGEVENGAP